MISYTSRRKVLVVAFGAPGDLWRKKKWEGTKRLYDLHMQQAHTWENPFRILPVGLEDLSSDFSAYLNQLDEKLIPSRQNQNWQEFCSHVLLPYQRAQSSDDWKTLFETIQRLKVDDPGLAIVFDLSIPHKGNIPTMRRLAPFIAGNEWTDDVFVFFEKPMAVTLTDQAELESIIRRAGLQREQVRLVDHFGKKVGFQSFVHWAYSLPANEAWFKSSAGLVRIVLTIEEEIGTEGRDYEGGVFVDSALNHGALVVALLNGNPYDGGRRLPMEALAHRLLKYAFYEDPNWSPEESLARRREFYEQIDPRGIYAICDEDAGPDGQTPTGMMLSFRGNSNRLTRDTVFVYRHLKNTGRKAFHVDFHLVGRDKQSHQVIRYYFDGFVSGARVFGSRITSPRLTFDGRIGEPTVVSELFPVPSWAGDGYTLVMKDMFGLGNPDKRGGPFCDDFPPIDFMRASLSAWGPWRDAMNRMSPANAIRFPRGTNPFKEMTWGDLPRLH